MKYIMIIILFVALVVLTGCFTFNLSGFVMPDDLEFLAVVQSLDTPKKISEYMVENFTYKASDFISKSPYELWEIGFGDCNDFSCFGKFIANYHDYTVYEIRIKFGSVFTHMICVYEEYLQNGKYSFTDNTKYYSGYNTLRGIVNQSANNVNVFWLTYTVFDYDGNIVEKGER